MDWNQELFKYGIYYPVVMILRQNVPRYISKLNKTQYLPGDELERIQIYKLKELINYSKEFVPYFAEKLSCISEEQINNIRDIKLLPLTTKIMLKLLPREFISTQKFFFAWSKTTGGSTGEPLTVWKNAEALGRELAATWRGYSWAGIDIGDRQARFWGIPFGMKGKLRAKVIDLIFNRKRCSAFAFTENNLEKFTQKLLSFNPKYFYGYVSMLSEYADYFKKYNITPPFNLKCIITTSEVLSSYHRNLLEEVFRTTVFNEYGCGELGSIAHECEYGSMHIMAENMIVEVLDGERSCREGEIGELVITELNNNAMPLLRYRTGDFGSISRSRCPCRRTLPVLDNLYGRAYDMVRNKEGKLFHGEFFMYIFEEAQRRNLGVNAFQVIQRDLQTFVVRIVPGNAFCSLTEEFIRNRVREKFDREAVIKFEKVEKIERTASGKMRLIIGMGANPQNQSIAMG